jgi:SAM-dependent methyltransferase
MGTGHFTRWLAEVYAPGTRIDAFGFSWAIIEKAVTIVGDLPNVRLLGANVRGRLPFPDEQCNIVFVRLAPLGTHGVPKVQAAYALLKPGGWFFGAGWEQTTYGTPPTAWALQHGYAQAEDHTWQCRRRQTWEEVEAEAIERRRLGAMGCEKPGQPVCRQTSERRTEAC